MLLTSTSDIIRIVTSSTADIHVQASWADITTTAFTPGRTNTVITSATTTTIVASPGSSTQRQVKSLSIYNAHGSTSNTVTIQHYDGTTSATVYKVTLAAGERAQYNGDEWPGSSTGTGITDGDKGDITVSSSGGTWTIDNGAVTYAKIQDVSATDKILGRSSSGAGDVEEITCTAAGRALLDDADASAQRTTLGLAIGTNVQAYDAELAALAGLTSAADKVPYFTGSGTAALADLSSGMRTFLTTSSSANLASVLTDETGTNKVVFSDNPALIQPTADNFINGWATTATAAGTTTLTVASKSVQTFTGSTTQTVVLPVVSTLVLGTTYTIVNLSSGVVTVQSSGANTIQAMQANSTLIVVSNATSGTGASEWNILAYYPAASSQTGSGSLVRATSPTFVTGITSPKITFNSTSGIIGTTTNDNAAAGSVGEVISSTVGSGSSVSLTTVTAADITSISLTAGDWDICWVLGFETGSTTSLTDVRGASSTTSATFPAFGGTTHPYTIVQFNSYVPGITTFGFGGGTQGRISVSGTTTVYLVARGTFSVSTLKSYGSIWARRVR